MTISHSIAVGRAIEQKAREAYRPTAAPGSTAAGRHIANDSRRSLLQRFKAHLAA